MKTLDEAYSSLTKLINAGREFPDAMDIVLARFYPSATIQKMLSIQDQLTRRYDGDPFVD